MPVSQAGLDQDVTLIVLLEHLELVASTFVQSATMETVIISLGIVSASLAFGEKAAI